VSQADFRRRVEAAAVEALARRKFVTPVDVCVGLGWLNEINLGDWRRGRVDDLEYFLPVHDDRLVKLVVYLDEWAQAGGLTRTETDYVAAARDRHQLRFFAGEDPVKELADVRRSPRGGPGPDKAGHRPRSGRLGLARTWPGRRPVPTGRCTSC
jgi:hypothetical protein